MKAQETSPSPTLPPDAPNTLHEAILYYADPAHCLAELIEARWPGGEVECPHCSSPDVTFIKTRRVWQCKSCRKQFSIKVGTVMEDSPIGLDKWLCAIWLITNAKNGISSYEIHRAIGVTQKTAWFLLHRIRLAMHNGSLTKLSGTVEADETFIGGLEKNKHEGKKLKAGRGAVGKTAVMGILERGLKDENGKPRKGKGEHSKVIAEVITDTSRKTLHGKIKARVSAGSSVHTDSLPAYRGLEPDYVHAFVDHAIAYVAGRVHTNGLENFWCLLDRMVKGTYIRPEPFHLARYIDEEVFRFNNRGDNDAGRFREVLKTITGRRITYKGLTASYVAYLDVVLPRQSEK